MTARSIRRAAERKAKKLARKSTDQGIVAMSAPTVEVATEVPTEAPVLTEILPAAAANANLSAVTSALTGQVTLLPTSDAAPYVQLLREYQNQYQPVGPQESELVQTLADTTWRARRALALEMAIFAKGRIEFAEQFAGHNPEIRTSLIEVHTFLVYEKQIRSLQLQEARLVRRADKARTELRALQADRQEREKAEQPPQSAQPTAPRQPASKQNGSVFSNHQMAPHTGPFCDAEAA